MRPPDSTCRVRRLWRALWPLALAAVLPLLTPPEAWAQYYRRVPRQYDALFAPRRVVDRGQQLDLTGQILVGYDNNSTPDPEAASDLYDDTLLGGGSLVLNYDANGRKAHFRLSLDGTTRYFDNIDYVATTYRAGASLRYDFSRRNSITIDELVTQSPFYFFQLYSPLFIHEFGQVPDVNPDLNLDRRDYFDALTHLTFDHRLSNTSSAYVEGAARLGDVGSGGTRRVSEYAVGGGYRRSVSRYATLRLGYRYVDQDARTTRHDIDVGVDYARNLSVSRRTQVFFSTGTTILRSRSTDPLPGEVSPSNFRLLLQAGLIHQFGRSWTGVTAYSRGVSLINGYSYPFNYDSFDLDINGYLNRRVEFTARTGLTFGSRVLTQSEDYRVIFGSVGFTVGLSRNVALAADYLAFRYDFEPRTIFDPATLERLDRLASRVYMTFWLPIAGRR